MPERNVTIPLPGFSPSGGIRMVIALANGLAREGIHVTILVPQYAATPPTALDEAINVRILPTGDGPFKKVLYPARLLGRLNCRHGLLVSTEYKTPLMNFLFCRVKGLRAKQVYLIQNYEPESHIRWGDQPAVLKPFLRAIARIGFAVPALRIAVSEFVSEKVGRHRIDAIVHPGIRAEFLESSAASIRTPRRFEDSTASGRSALRVGFLPAPGRVKGVAFAIEAFSRLREEGLDAEFIVFDMDYPTDEIPSFVRRFSASVPEGGPRAIVDFYRSLDVFVFPSLVEGFGLPPVEAMACGAAVVVSDSGGVRAYARDGENCLLVPARDAGAIAMGVRKLIEDQDLRNKLVSAGRKTAESLPESRFVDECAKIVRSLIEEAPRSHARGNS